MHNTTESINTKINDILQARRQKLPSIEKEITRWNDLQHKLQTLESTVSELRQHDKTTQETRLNLAGLHFGPVQEAISSTLASLGVLKGRLMRDTLNIGVSGRARVGKSTLLQSIAGLNDEQIPTGSGLPVTAVRSRIFHSPQSRATLILHTYDSFRRDVLQPYHSELGLPEAPQSLDGFRDYRYPQSEADLPGDKAKEASSVTLLRRLKEMHQALPSYEAELGGGEKIVGLNELRQYVAYPTAEQIEKGECNRRYLAVRDVRIECPFPHAKVNQLGIIDLPGLGELAANAEEHHVAGLQNEVDFVLLVKRPVEGMAYWGKEDGAATNLLDKARGLIQNRRDFVSVVLNTGGANDSLASALRGDVLRNVNDGVAGKHFQVLETDARDQHAVYEQVLNPVLQHLAERLPVMDQQIIAGTQAEYQAAAQRVGQMLADVEKSLSLAKGALMDASAAEQLEELTRKLHRNMARDLKTMLTELKKKARDRSGDTTFEEAVEQAYQSAVEWIDAGLGMESKEAWCANAVDEFAVKGGFSGFVLDECNRIRVEISNRFAGIDAYFSLALDDLWTQLSNDILNKHLGNLLQGHQGKDGLQVFAKLLEEGEEPCPTFYQAMQELLGLRLDYRTQLHPRVRASLDDLEGEVADEQNPSVKHARFSGSINEAGAQVLFREISNLARYAIYQTKKALCEEIQVPALVIHAAVEQLDDTLIRSGDSEREFRRLARSYRDDIWPSTFAEAEAANARVARVRGALKAIRTTLEQ